MNDEQVSYSIAGEDDMDYVEMLGLDPALAYTPEINKAIIDKVMIQNQEELESQGLPPEEVERKVREIRAYAEERVSVVSKSRGY